MSAATHNVDVLALAKTAGIAAGNHINVVFTIDSEPMIRTLNEVDIQRRHGKDWLIWRWEKEGQTPWGTSDCGFAGNLLHDDFVAALANLASAGGAA